MKRKAMTSLVCILSFTGLAQCGDEAALSSKVKWENRPDTGIVVNAPITINVGTDAEQTIQPPWFLWGYRFDNLSSETLVVATVKFNSRAKYLSNPTIGENAVDPTTICPTPDYDAGDTGRPTLIELPSGAAGTGFTDICNLGSYTTTVQERWYLELPLSDSLVYNIGLEAIGWFEDSNGIQLERFLLVDYMLAK